MSNLFAWIYSDGKGFEVRETFWGGGGGEPGLKILGTNGINK
jgi:hypothetical protein